MHLVVAADPPPVLALSTKLLFWSTACRPGIRHRLLHVASDGHDWTIGLLGLARSWNGGIVFISLDHDRQKFAWRSYLYGQIQCPGGTKARHDPHWVKRIVLLPGRPWRCLACTEKDQDWRYSIFDVMSPLRWRPTKELVLTHEVLDIAGGTLSLASADALVEHRRARAAATIPFLSR